MIQTIATLFSGGELFGVGAKQAGFEHIWGIELDDKVASVARRNGFKIHTGNVIEFDKSTLRTPNHLHASPPCPNFSVAKNGGKETELDIKLADSVCDYILYFKPDSFTLENVTAYAGSESLKLIMKCLHDLGYWTDVQNLNAADFGVPQTRRRLIVRARLGMMLCIYPDPVKWVGWYEAIEDLIPTLPESQFAPWQIERLPQEYKDFVVSFITRPTKYDRSTARGKEYKMQNEPVPTVLAKNSSMRAFIAAGGSAGKNILTKETTEPIFTIKGNAGGREPVRAFVLNGTNMNSRTFRPRDEEEPHHTITASMERTPSRAMVHEGRVVKMTLQALGRFQTVPDDYVGLTTKINGNGVPCKLAEAVMTTFKE